jgi:hypothetical protein
MITRGMLTIVAVFSLMVIAPIAYMLADNQPPYVYDEGKSYVVPSVTTAGRQMTVYWHFKKVNRVCIGSITRHVVDQDTGVRFSYDPTAAARTVELGDNLLTRTFFLPPDVTPGKKWYYADAEFACNPLQRIYPLRVRTPRLSFEVT